MVKEVGRKGGRCKKGKGMEEKGGAEVGGGVGGKEKKGTRR